MFLSVNLPTLMAPGNLPSFAVAIPTRYRIFTTAADRRTMLATPLFRHLRQLIKVEIVEIPRASTVDPIVAHHRLWSRAIAEAKEQGALIVLIPPDVLWSDGSFAHVAQAIASGRSAIFMTYLRVVSETFVEEFRSESPSIRPRRLLETALRHLHPVIAAYHRDGQHFPRHSEMVIWPVGGDGFLMRMLARELFLFDPRRFKLNAQQLLREPPNAADIHVVRDSDDLLALSLTPFLKDASWYVSPHRLDAFDIGRWWLEYDSPANEIIARQNVRFRLGNASETAWRRVEHEADNLIGYCLVVREAMRIARVLEFMGCEGAARLLAVALKRAHLARHWRIRDPIVVLAPDRRALRSHDLGPWLMEGGEPELRQAIAAHVAPLPPELASKAGKPLDEPCRLALRTLAGEDVEVLLEPTAAATDNVAVALRPQWMWAHRNLVVRTSRLLLLPDRPGPGIRAKAALRNSAA